MTAPNVLKENLINFLTSKGFKRLPEMTGIEIYQKSWDNGRLLNVDFTNIQHIDVFWEGNGGRDHIDDDNETLATWHKLIIETCAMPKPMPIPPISDTPISDTEDLQKPENYQSDLSGSKNTPAVPEPAQALTPPDDTYPVRRYRPPVPQASIFEPQGRMIQGLIPQLKEIGKIKIGRKGESRQSQSGREFRLPEKFDHFEVVSLERDEHGDLRPDLAVMNLIGSNAKELDVMLLYNDPTLNFMTRYNEYKGGKCQCQGDGQLAVDINGTEKECNPDECLQFQARKCKPNGILSVILMKSPRLGGVYKFRTTSYNSIRSLLSSMFFLQTVTGGQLAGIPLKLTISPMTVQPAGSPTIQTIYVVNLEFHGTMEDLQNTTLQISQQRGSMISKIAELEKVARAALDAPESEQEIQDIEAEFYPVVEA